VLPQHGTMNLGRFTAVLLSLLLPCITTADEAQAREFMDQMENDVKLLAKAVENDFKSRCNTSLHGCNGSNYDAYYSKFPTPTCVTSMEDYFVANCTPSGGGGGQCGALFDFNASNVVLNCEIDGNGNPTNPVVIESICYSRSLDTLFQEIQQNYTKKFAEFGVPKVEAFPMYFGSQQGMFRIFPARLFESSCGFDPRNRSWYNIATSSPKNVILVLDTSNSMSGERFSILKKTAQTVINNLLVGGNNSDNIVGDRVAIIPFNEDSYVIGENNLTLLELNASNKQFLLDKIDSLVASGGDNLYGALERAFATLKESIDSRDYPSAILLLTNDPELTNSSDSVVQLVNDKVQNISVPQKILFFTYSIGDRSNDFNKTLACQSTTNNSIGFWSEIVNISAVFDGLTSYSRIFAHGTGDPSWVKPYPYISGKINGTTVSAAAFDNSQNPPLLLGVVGIDLNLKTLDLLFGDEKWKRDSELTSRIQSSTQSAPSLNELDSCALEKFRYFAGNDSVCYFSENCTLEAIKVCQNISHYQIEVWNNKNFQSKGSYREKVCCTVGQTEPSTQCYDTSNANKTNVILLSVFLGVLLPACVFALWFTKKRRKSLSAEDTQVTQAFNEQSSTHEADVNQPFPTTEDPVTPYSSSSFSQSQGGTTGNSSFTGSSSFVQSQGGTTGYPPFICEGPRSPSPEEHVVIVYADPVH